MTPAQLQKNQIQPETIAFTRDLTTAAGSVSYTGVGFKPRAVICSYGMQAGALAMGVSLWEDGDADRGGFVRTSGNTAYPTPEIFIETSGGNYQNGSLTSFDSDGFTINWGKTGSPTGTALVYCLCIP